MTFSELLARLPRPSTKPDLVQVDLGITYAPPLPDTYVEPHIESVQAVGSTPRVLLVQAAAAVGKTALARVLASRTGNLYWHLGPPYRVGSHFFTGTLVRALGGRGFAQVEAAVADGGMCLILDAADEALSAAGVANYEQAILDLALLLRDAASDGVAPPSVMILGRPETVELTSVVLAQSSIEFEILQIGFFDEATSRSFVSRRYQDLSGAVNTRAIEDFTDAVFGRMRAAIRTPYEAWSPELQSFLGYAPVLDAVATLASDSANLYADAQELARSAEGTPVWRLMSEIVEAILDRERDRFASSFAAGETGRYAAASVAFSSSEQLRMLLARDFDQVSVTTPSDVDPLEAQALVASAQQRLREHPFLRAAGRQEGANALLRFANVVFRDYVGGFGLTADDSRLRAETVANYSDATLNPSPLLIRLLVTGRLGANGCPAEALAAVIDSAATPLSDTRTIGVSVGEAVRGVARQGLGMDNESLVVDRGVTVSVSEDGDPIGALVVENIDEGLPIGRQCKSLLVDLPHATVRIGSGQQAVRMGPNVVIRCGVFQSDSDEIRYRGSVSISCETLRSTTSRIVSRDQQSLLQVSTDKAAYPWHAYLRGVPVREPDDFELLQVGLEFRKLINWFAISTSLTLQEKTVERLIKKGRLSDDVVLYCKDSGILEFASPLVFLRPPVAVMSIRELRLEDPGMRELLNNYFAWLQNRAGIG